MPYKKNSELPESVRNTLPSEAQTIFRKAFNASFKAYGEVSAFKIAWSAVKRSFHKVGERWIKRK